MAFKVAEKQTIETALEIAQVAYGEITYFANERIVIKQEITDPQIIALAQAGIFKALRPTAVIIWATLGSTKSFEDNDIEYFIIFSEGRAYAKYEIYPDMKRTAYNAVVREPVQEGVNWNTDRDEVLLNAAIEIIEAEESEEAEVETSDDVIVKVITRITAQHYIGYSKVHAARMLIRDLFTKLFKVENPRATIKELSTQISLAAFGDNLRKKPVFGT